LSSGFRGIRICPDDAWLLTWPTNQHAILPLSRVDCYEFRGSGFTRIHRCDRIIDGEDKDADRETVHAMKTPPPHKLVHLSGPQSWMIKPEFYISHLAFAASEAKFLFAA
jgi:hypothetical protein